MFWVTHCVGLGPHPTGEMPAILARAGISHVLNVGSGPGDYGDRGLFTEVVWHHVEDLKLIPTATARRCLDSLHRMLHHEPRSTRPTPGVTAPAESSPRAGGAPP